MWRLLKNNGCREWGSNTQADLWTFTTVLWCDSEATTCGQTGMWHLSSNISACTCCHLSFIGVDVCLSAAFGHNIFLLLTCGLDHNSWELSSDRGSLGKKTGHVTSRHTWGMWPPLSPIFTLIYCVVCEDHQHKPLVGEVDRHSSLLLSDESMWHPVAGAARVYILIM